MRDLSLDTPGARPLLKSWVMGMAQEGNGDLVMKQEITAESPTEKCHSLDSFRTSGRDEALTQRGHVFWAHWPLETMALGRKEKGR